MVWQRVERESERKKDEERAEINWTGEGGGGRGGPDGEVGEEGGSARFHARRRKRHRINTQYILQLYSRVEVWRVEKMRERKARAKDGERARENESARPRPRARTHARA